MKSEKEVKRVLKELDKNILDNGRNVFIECRNIRLDRYESYEFREALKKIASLEVGLWKTAQKIAREVLDKREISRE